MTATTVNGRTVVADEPTPSPMQTRDGKPIVWTQTRMLLLDNGDVVYGCQHCEFTSSSPNGIRPHLAKHKDAKDRPTPAARTAVKDLTLDQLVARVADLKRIETERDGWKTRALDAEKKLTTLRNALRG